MLGTLRFVLAVMVLLNHTWLPVANRLGAHAVIGFYVISGYLMTLMINEVYTGWGGAVRYFANRVLRIFPTYWLVSAVTFVLVAIEPATFSGIHPAMRLPDDLGLWLRNVFLVDLIYSPVRIVPPAWSLTVEWFFYIGMGLVLARGRAVAALWFAASLAYTIHLVLSDARFGDRYYPVTAASLFFSLGCVLCHARPFLKRVELRPPLWGVLLVAYCALPLIVEAAGGDRHTIGYYGALVLFLPLFAGALNGRAYLPAKWDRRLGDLAYPVFLLHFLSLGLVRLIAPSRLAPYSTGEAATVLAVTVGLALVVVTYFDPIITRPRDAIRPRHASTTLGTPRAAAPLLPGSGPPDVSPGLDRSQH